jgi:hypothetical protein
MKRMIICVFFLIAFELILSARIETQRNGKYLAVRFYADSLEIVTEEYFAEDFWNAIAIAKAQKCNTISFYGNDGFTFCFINGKDEINMADVYLDDILKNIAGMEEQKYIQGEEIGSERVTVSGAKYRQETYLNGKLHDVYESDWDSGPFAKRESTYRSGGDTYVTKTFYVPPKHTNKAKYAAGSYVTIPGIVVFAEKTYTLERDPL